MFATVGVSSTHAIAAKDSSTWRNTSGTGGLAQSSSGCPTMRRVPWRLAFGEAVENFLQVGVGIQLVRHDLLELDKLKMGGAAGFEPAADPVDGGCSHRAIVRRPTGPRAENIFGRSRNARLAVGSGSGVTGECARVGGRANRDPSAQNLPSGERECSLCGGQYSPACGLVVAAWDQPAWCEAAQSFGGAKKRQHIAYKTEVFWCKY